MAGGIEATRMIEGLRERAEVAEKRAAAAEEHIREFREALRTYIDALRRRANVNPIERPVVEDVRSVLQTLVNQSIERQPEPETGTPR